MKKGNVGMAKHFSKQYGNKGWAFNYLQSETYAKMPVSACYILTSLPQEPAAKSSMVSEVRIQAVFSVMYSWEVCG